MWSWICILFRSTWYHILYLCCLRAVINTNKLKCSLPKKTRYKNAKYENTIQFVHSNDNFSWNTTVAWNCHPETHPREWHVLNVVPLYTSCTYKGRMIAFRRLQLLASDKSLIRFYVTVREVIVVVLAQRHYAACLYWSRSYRVRPVLW